MKTLKKTRKVLAIFLMCVFFIPTIVSCTEDKPEIPKHNDNFDSSINEYRRTFREIQGHVNELKLKSQNTNLSRNYDGVEITQELIDEYSEIVGYEPGTISIELVNSILDMKNDLEGQTFEEYMENYEISEFAKNEILKISNGNIFPDLIDQEEFQNLPVTEKDLIVMGMTFEQEFNSYYGQHARLDFDWNTRDFLAGALLGAFVFSTYAGAILTGLAAVLVINIVSWVTK